MSFPGSFADHILPEKTHVLSVSFLVDSLRRQRGGVAGNIAYNLALLGARCALVGSVGSDFGPYREHFGAMGIDLSAVVDFADELTATAFMMTDRRDNQIASFFPGASGHAGELSVAAMAAGARYGLVGAAAPVAMRRHAAEIAASGCRLVYDPSQQVVALSPGDLVAGFDQAWAVVGNDYEFAMIEQKTGLTLDDLESRVDLLVVTYGEAGSELRQGGRRVRVPAAKTDDVRDPTGAGDAYRAGLLKGLLLDLDLEIVGRMAGLAATYAVERHGTQEHAYTPVQFVERFDAAFPDVAGSITAADLRPGRTSGAPLTRT
jgi:adenosine kinase